MWLTILQVSTFSELGLSKNLIKGLNELGIHQPTKIQEEAIAPLIKNPSDMVAQAQTGTGKTAAFGVPIIEHINPERKVIQAIILAPTRELCQQIGKQLFKFTKYTDRIFIETVYGGAKIGDQIKRLERPTHIIVATPGRLIDLMERKVVDLSDVRIAVLDEADEMLSMGFQNDMFAILDQLSANRNTWLFSATMPDGIQQIIKKFLQPGALRIKIDRTAGVNENITHEYLICRTKDKVQELMHFLSYHQEERGMIFCQTKRAAQTLNKQLQARNINVDVIEGDMGQRDRDKVMRKFKTEKIDLLIATDIAARGIDVKELNFVLHYQLPQQIEYYTHRAGRTGRAGHKGSSIAFISDREKERVYEIGRTLKIGIKPLN